MCIDCGVLTIENGDFVYEGTYFGDTAEVTCIAGYELDGDSRLSCLDGPRWSDIPTCNIKSNEYKSYTNYLKLNNVSLVLNMLYCIAVVNINIQ